MLTQKMPEEQTIAGRDFEINLLDVAIVFAKYLKLLIALPVITGLITGILAFRSPNFYTADTTFLPPKQASSVSSMVSSLSSLGNISGMLGMGGGSGGLSGANEIYVAVLKSRYMQDAMIKRFKLFEVYHTKSKESARMALAEQTEIKTSKDGLISLQVSDTNPNRAALLANGYVEMLLEKNNDLALSEASQRRLFAEKEFLNAKDRLSDAEISLKKLQENTGLITVGSQITALQAMIKSTERKLAEMSVYSTPNNPDYIKTRQKLNNLQAEIGKAQQGSGYVSKAPEKVLDFMRKTRDLKYAEAIYQLALQQLTLAKVDESKAAASIQVVDRAVVPEQKAGPSRSRSVLVAAIAGFFGAIVIAFCIEAYQRVKQDTESASQLETIKSYLRWNKVQS